MSTLQARQSAAATLALQAWVQDQINSNTKLNALQRLALGHIPLDIYGQIVTVVLDAADKVPTTEDNNDAA